MTAIYRTPTNSQSTVQPLSILENNQLAPGTYKLLDSKLLNSTLEEVVNPKDFIKVDQDCYPVNDIFGLNVYQVTHAKTKQPLYITVGELTR